MSWRYPLHGKSGTDANGIERLADTLSEATGGADIAGTRFTYNSTEMLDLSREIEATATEQLFVGFQFASIFDREAKVYEALARRGASVTGFGTGRPVDEHWIRWIEVPFDRAALENQWFLVSTAPYPIAFVSYELSPTEEFGRRGATRGERRFSGFRSSDVTVVNRLVRHLTDVATEKEPAFVDLDLMMRRMASA